jgi:hypothetical protein
VLRERDVVATRQKLEERNYARVRIEKRESLASQERCQNLKMEVENLSFVAVAFL